ncbi:MAG TPA: hypothetical protein VGN70_11030 [Gammaproteobacteria bacterium]
MNIKTKTLAAWSAAAVLALLCSMPVQADDTTAASGDLPVLYLGKLPITGQQQIVDTLLAIKAALKEPLSDDPAEADKVVCRIGRGTGTALEYLDCATNRTYSMEHNHLQSDMLVRRTGLPVGEYGESTQQDFDGLISQQPHQRLHVPIKGAALKAILDNLPDDAKVVPQDGSQP